MQLKVLPYKSESVSAKSLANSLGCKRLKLTGSKVTDNPELVIVNWGNSTQDLSHLPSAKVFNKPENVKLASNKLNFFRTIEEENKDAFVTISIPDWTTSRETAKGWYQEGHDVVARKTLQGHSGDGIELIRYKDGVSPAYAIPEAPLYTKYVKKRDEYRVHVFNGVPILIQRKAVRSGENPENYQIRNHGNGFIYVINDVNPDESVISEAINAVTVLGLDFGAVDVIWNEYRSKATVLEVNTACGLQGETTLSRYKSAINNALERKTINRFDQPCSAEDADQRLKFSLEEHNYDDQDYNLDVDEGDSVCATALLETLFVRYLQEGGNDEGIKLWAEADYNGIGGYFWCYWVNHRRNTVKLTYTDNEDNSCGIDFVVPMSLIDYL